MSKLKPASSTPSNIISENRKKQRTSKLVRSRVRPPEMLPNLTVVAYGTIPQIRERITMMRNYVGIRRSFTELEHTEMKILLQKLNFQRMLQRVES